MWGPGWLRLSQRAARRSPNRRQVTTGSSSGPKGGSQRPSFSVIDLFKAAAQAMSDLYEPGPLISKGRDLNRLEDAGVGPLHARDALRTHTSLARAAIRRGDLNEAAHHVALASASGQHLGAVLHAELLLAAASSGTKHLVGVLIDYADAELRATGAGLASLFDDAPAALFPALLGMCAQQGLSKQGCFLFDSIGGASTLEKALVLKREAFERAIEHDKQSMLIRSLPESSSAPGALDRGLACSETLTALCSCLAREGRLEDALSVLTLSSQQAEPFPPEAEAALARFWEHERAQHNGESSDDAARRVNWRWVACWLDSGAGEIGSREFIRVLRLWDVAYDHHVHERVSESVGGGLSKLGLRVSLLSSPPRWAAVEGSGTLGEELSQLRDADLSTLNDLPRGVRVEDLLSSEWRRAECLSSLLKGGLSRWRAMTGFHTAAARLEATHSSPLQTECGSLLRSLVSVMRTAFQAQVYPPASTVSQLVDVVISEATKDDAPGWVDILVSLMEQPSVELDSSQQRSFSSVQGALLRGVIRLARTQQNETALLKQAFDLYVSHPVASRASAGDLLAPLLRSHMLRPAAVVAADALCAGYSAPSSTDSTRDRRWDHDRPERALDALVSAGEASTAVRIAAAAARAGRPLNTTYASRLLDHAHQQRVPQGSSSRQREPWSPGMPYPQLLALSVPDQQVLSVSPAWASHSAVVERCPPADRDQSYAALRELERAVVLPNGRCSPEMVTCTVRALLSAGLVNAALFAWEISRERVALGWPLASRLAAMLLAEGDPHHHPSRRHPTLAEGDSFRLEAAAVLSHTQCAARYSAGATAFRDTLKTLMAEPGASKQSASVLAQRAADLARQHAPLALAMQVHRAGTRLDKGSPAEAQARQGIRDSTSLCIDGQDAETLQQHWGSPEARFALLDLHLACAWADWAGLSPSLTDLTKATLADHAPDLFLHWRQPFPPAGDILSAEARV
jgi:hypothetical protein